LTGLASTHLFDMTVVVDPIYDYGATPVAERDVAIVQGGRFQGPRMRGVIMPGGSDWRMTRADGVIRLDVRLVLQTDDQALIGVSYIGLRHGPPEVMARLGRGEAVDPSLYYFRVAPFFETAAPKYAWLNTVIAIGIGDRQPSGPVYRFYLVD